MNIKDLLSKATHRGPKKDLIEGIKTPFEHGEIRYIRPVAEETTPGSGRYYIYVQGNNSIKRATGNFFDNGDFRYLCFEKPFDKSGSELMLRILHEQFVEKGAMLPIEGMTAARISDFAPISQRQPL